MTHANMYKTHVNTYVIHYEHIYVDIYTSRHHNTWSHHKYINGTSLDTKDATTDDFTVGTIFQTSQTHGNYLAHSRLWW